MNDESRSLLNAMKNQLERETFKNCFDLISIMGKKL